MTLAIIPILRVLRSKQTWIWVVSAVALALGSAFVQRSHGAPHGADHTLLNLYSSVAVPLAVFAIASATTGGSGLARSAVTLYRLGAPGRQVVLATLGVSLVGSALVSGALGAAVAVTAHGASDPPLGMDTLHTLLFGALAGAAYAAYFGLGSVIGAGGWGRLVLLVVDWVFGAGTDVAASLTPRAHFRNLLGGEAPLDLAPEDSLVALVLLGALFVLVAATLAARRLRVAS